VNGPPAISAGSTTKPLSEELTEKSIAAAISAIEIYNKPDFKFREETFAILMVNAWELLLKARALKDCGENMEAIIAKDPKTGEQKRTRSGNALTHEVTFLARKFVDGRVPGMSAVCHDNICLLVEVRDNAIHFVNRDLNFSRRIQEIGTASLKNYLDLASRWFGLDLSRYNFYLMPLSFYHGFEAVEAASVSKYSEQTQNFLRYLQNIENNHGEPDLGGHQVTVCIETKFVRAKTEDALSVRFTADPAAPAVQIREEDVLKSFPIRYRDLERALRDRYPDFKADQIFRRIMREIHAKGRPFCLPRYLDPGHKTEPPKWFYSSAMFEELDKHYRRKTESDQNDAVPGNPVLDKTGEMQSAMVRTTQEVPNP
jgi:hypothetical protein